MKKASLSPSQVAHLRKLQDEIRETAQQLGMAVLDQKMHETKVNQLAAQLSQKRAAHAEAVRHAALGVGFDEKDKVRLDLEKGEVLNAAEPAPEAERKPT